ncbi:MAG TPA: N-acetyltransferase [Prevotella sp.]|nr:N-acetyltransferase [Prevotella sp.]
MRVDIKQVETGKELKAFIQFRYDLYRGDTHAVPFLYADELSTLDRKQNPAFDYCDAAYFLAFKAGKVVGRIAAIINTRANTRWNQRMVRFGWFDFIDDLEVSSRLIAAVEHWGAERGMTEIGGPFGFDDMDREGMLVEGFDRLATLYINYNFPYYPTHMEAMGRFRKDNDYLEYRIRVPEVTPTKFAKLSEMIERRYNLHAHKFTRDELLHQGMGRRVFDILNSTYNNLYGFAQLSDRQVDKLVNDYIRKADLNLVTGVVDGNEDNKLVGFGISFPSFSRALQHTRDGRLLPFGWWHLLRVLKWHKTDTVDLLLIGVLPEYRAKGANALIFNDLIGRYRQYGFRWAEAMPQMETNKGVLSQWQYLEAENHRRHRIYARNIEEAKH